MGRARRKREHALPRFPFHCYTNPKAKKTDIDTRRASVEHEIAQLDDQQRLLAQVEVETAALVDYCTRVRQNLTQFDLAEKRLALEALNLGSPMTASNRRARM